VFDSFNSQEFPFLDPIYEFPRIFPFVQNFLYLVIKKFPFGDLDCFLENFPIVQLSWISISFQKILVVFIPLWFWMLHDIDQFWIFVLDVIHIVSEFLYNAFKIFFVVDINGIELFDQYYDFLNKVIFFFAIFNNCTFSSLNVFFKKSKFSL